MSKDTETPSAPGPASHWHHDDPAAQPPRDQLIGVGRLVVESRTRLGCGTDQAAVLADLIERGLNVTAADVARYWDHAC